MSEKKSENILLKETPPSSPSAVDNDVKTKGLFQVLGLYLSKTRLIILAVIIFILILIIIILAVLLGHANAKLSGAEAEAGKGSGTVTPTSPSSPIPTTAGTEAWWNVRLPKDIVPVHYEVLLDIDLEKLRFDGNVVIYAKVMSPTKLVLVHVNKMNVTSVKVQNEGEKDLAIDKHFFFEKNQFYVMEMGSTLEKGAQIAIKMSFEAFLTGSLKGLYKSQYQHKDGKNITIAATQFQPTDARRAFPCFDEPQLKATFSVILVHRRDFIALSNMPVVKTETKGGKKYDYFQKTVIMPTYLLAFVVCDFKYKEITTANGVLMRFYAPPDQIDQVDYAVSIGGKMMTFFENYYNISYPLPKSDMIAIPDFAAGAMENWGLILYRETALLWKNGSSSEENKQRVAAVVAHELAHMWFGNLVTMKWWDDLWLNEGFASFVEYPGVAAVEPDWAMDEQIVIADMASAFRLDGLSSSHPIKVDVNHPDEINEIFDSISYNKGASILRMLESILGRATFVAGLTKYLRRHAYGNAETDDLWKALEEESCSRGKCVQVKQIMDTWTLQMGYPVVEMKRKDGTHYTLSQKHFLYNPNANVSASKFKSPFGYKWVIPFAYKTSTQSQLKTVMLNMSSVDIPWDGTGWIKGNYGQYGFYRVNYAPEHWAALSQQLTTNHEAFSISDRAGLIGDAFNLARAKMINYSVALESTSYIRNETKWVPWDAALVNLNYVMKVLSQTRPAYKYLQKYLVYQSELQFKKLGFQDTGSHLDKYNRNDVLSIYCRAGRKECLGPAIDYFKKWMADPVGNPVPADFRTLVYYYGVANGGEEEWNFVYKQFKKSNVASEKKKLMRALSASKEPWILERYLTYSLDTTKIRPQDALWVASDVANYNSVGRQLTWNFLRYNWDTYRKRYGSGFFSFSYLISSVTSGFTSEYQLNELISFKTKHPDAGSGTRALQQSVERVKANIQWLKDNEDNIEGWLKKFLKDRSLL